MDIEDLTNQQLVDRYRLNRDGLLFITTLIEDKLQSAINRRTNLPPLNKVLITLRYLATGGIQLNDADIHHVSQPSVSRAVTQVLDALTDPVIISRFIRFPRNEEIITEYQQQFHGIANFPNVIGVIDGTHVRIQAPSRNEADYVNRMGYHSINAQIAFGPNESVIDIVSRWPGSTHDSRMLRESGLWALFEGQGNMPPGQKYLLGDSGYPCKRWLLTPYLNPQPGSQSAYNRAHKITRCRVERGIGQIKKRWGILRTEIRMDPGKVCKVIICCAVLHNICKARNVPMPDDMQDIYLPQHQVPQGNVGPEDGLRYRDFVARTYF